jgi:superfamily I DNA/RNA helicase
MKSDNPVRKLQQEIAASQETDAGFNIASLETGLLPDTQEITEHKITKIYGPPGTGKTTTLINHVRVAIADGISPLDIGYFSFTNKATEEAKSRMAAEFPNLNVEEDFPGFRTLHSLAYQHLPNRISILDKDQAVLFDKSFTIEEVYMRENDPTSIVIRAKQIVIDAAATARARMVGFEQHLASLDGGARYRLKKWLGYIPAKCDQPFTSEDIFRLVSFNNSFEEYKKKINAIDYTAILEKVLQDGVHLSEYKLLIIDEAQDLSLLQWELVRRLISKAEKVYIAGDDDQAICESFGAAPNEFLAVPGVEIVLDESYRLTNTIHERLFNPKGLLALLTKRFPRKLKSWKVSVKEDGCWERTSNFHGLLAAIKKDPKDWLILAVTHQTLVEFSRAFESGGIEHYLSNKLVGLPKSDGTSDTTIRLMTVWGAKGGEAEKVVLIRGKYLDELMLAEDPRLHYVAATRAKKHFLEYFPTQRIAVLAAGLSNF